MNKYHSISTYTYLTLFSLLSLFNSAMAADSVTMEALSKVISPTVNDCSLKAPYVLPLITWGGDIPTVFANGNDSNTQPGSIFDQTGLNFTLKREDVFLDQVQSYLSCKSPFLRGTAGMINLAAEVTEKDPRTKMKVIYQMTWSAGGDAMVVKPGIKSPKDLKGKTIAVQAYGPHVDYLSKVLSDAGLSFKDVKIHWTIDLTGTSHTPGEALKRNDVLAAMVIIPDALALTSGGTVGTGAEDSVKGAKILLSTKSANRIIADVYAVRSDFYKSHPQVVQQLVRSLLQAQEKVSTLFKAKNTKPYGEMIRGAAQVLLDSPQAIQDTEGMYADAEFVGWSGNQQFFASPNYPRKFEKINREIQDGYKIAGLLTKSISIAKANWDYNQLKAGLTLPEVPSQRFDPQQVAKW